MSKEILHLQKRIEKIIESCPELTFVGNAVLRQKTTEVTLEEGIKVGRMLQETLTKIREITGYGRGLAAPQIGENKSVFITFTDETFKIYINPKITSMSSEECLYKENCLSCGPLWGDVKRPKSIVMEYMDENGNQQEIKSDGFLARLLQHEYDHLDGIINLDKIEKGTMEFMVSDPLKETLREIA